MNQAFRIENGGLVNREKNYPLNLMVNPILVMKGIRWHQLYWQMEFI